MRRRKPASLAGRDSYHVLDGTGAQLAVKGAAPHALVVAQGLAQKHVEPVVLTVSRRSLFGPAVTLYRVTRTEQGDVFTNTNQED
jgi:hypothetical protein